ncbi:MAG: ABC transporter ATP-binding protein [Candidatus Heimdallarchaeota archaeon]|nr:ABC transporter ATP-binding protein [Candidatus Heimdallarchaeota archaeon]MCK4253304.1 ABC transporter ATP-binding protein [Candidatus Heimdallarchaeota archaeon]
MKLLSKEIAVKTRGLIRSFEFGESEVYALSGVDMEVYKGEFVVVLGPSGAGKTTLLNMIGGIDLPTEGEVFVGEENITNYTTNEMNTFRRNEVGWVFQFFNIVASLRAWENVGLALEFQGEKDKHEVRRRSFEELKKVGLEGKEYRFPSQLSGGEQQRVAIARALVKNPKILVADEPTGNLDFVTGQSIAELLRKLNEKEKTTLIVVSHDISITQYADRVFHLRMGKIEKIEENPTDNGTKKVRVE